MDQSPFLMRKATRKVFAIKENERGNQRRERQSRELEQNQRELRASIAESKRLTDEAEVMIQRHRKEWSDYHDS